MDFGPLVMMITGLVILVVSFMNSRHPRSSEKHIAVHKNMSDDRIEAQFAKGAPRADAGLGYWFGGFIIAAAITWQFLPGWMISTI